MKSEKQTYFTLRGHSRKLCFISGSVTMTTVWSCKGNWVFWALGNRIYTGYIDIYYKSFKVFESLSATDRVERFGNNSQDSGRILIGQPIYNYHIFITYWPGKCENLLQLTISDSHWLSNVECEGHGL